MNWNYLVGILYLLYAFVKITVGLCVLLLPLNTIQKIPIVNIFTKEAADKTFAGRMYEYVLLVFGIFTLFEGLALLELLTPALSLYFESKYTDYIVFITLGTILVVFYSLVLYTDLPIQKNKDDYEHYKLLGLVGGITFLIMPVLWEIISYIIPKFNQLTYAQKSICIMSVIILLLIIIESIYRYLKRKNETIVQALPPVYQQNVEDVKTALNIKK